MKYGETALIAECRAVAGAEPGSRNVRLNKAAYALGQLVAAGQLDATTAAAGLAAAAQAAGLGDAEARAAITSGMRAGAAQPRRPQAMAAPTAQPRRPQPAPTAVPAPTAAPQPAQPQQTDDWRLGAQAALERAQAALTKQVTVSHGIVRFYATERRGLAPTTLAAWGCGAALYRGCQTLCWPVYGLDGQLVAVRCRVIGAGQLRYVATPGSRLAGAAAGSQLLWAERTAPLRCLLVAEGELNGMSAWQVAHPAGLDVLSLGSQAATVPAWLIRLAGRYGAVLTWFDKADRAAAVLGSLGVTAGLALHSQVQDGGKADANDGLIGGWLAMRLWEARHHLAERLGGDAVRRLAWQYWEVADTLGDDVRTAVRAAAAISGGGLW